MNFTPPNVRPSYEVPRVPIRSTASAPDGGGAERRRASPQRVRPCLPPRATVHHLRMSEHTDATEDREDDDSADATEEKRIRETDAEQPQPVAKTSSGSTELGEE